ncbi:MAG TPA: hypothetical protein DG753_03690 [Clostridium sp.]|nr:hypothetical protein [Clostridium sp.]
MTNEIEEELKELPKEWIDLLNSIPEIKDLFIEDMEFNEDEIIPPYFFSYFEEDYKECEPFFTCFERGKEVFDNFYELYGDEPFQPSELDDMKDILLVKKHIEAMNYLLQLSNAKAYNVNHIKEMSERDFSNKYDIYDIDNVDIENCWQNSMWDNILPKKKDSFLMRLVEALYQVTSDYNLIFYILWPLGKRADVENPYRAYVELWSRGVKPYIIDENLAVAVK